MPRYTSSSRSKSYNSRSSSGKKRTSSKKSAQRQQVQSLSPETKKDIVGGLLAILGIVSVLGFFSSDQGVFLGWFSHVMKLIGGWGGIFIPLALLAVGLWLLFRNVEKFPRLSAGRTTGILLIYVNLVTWFHFVTLGTQTTASLGQGGGYLGYFFDKALENTLGRAGAGVFLVAWSVIALTFIIDLPLPEIAHRLEKGFSRSDKSATIPAASQPRLQTKHPQKALSYEERTELPDGFNPINLYGGGEKPQIVVTPRQRVRETAPTSAAAKPAAQPFIPEKINDNAPAATTVRPQKGLGAASVEAILTRHTGDHPDAPR